MKLISRKEWGARAPKASLTTRQMTAKSSLHYNGPDTKLDENSTPAQEAAFLRVIQDIHMDTNGWNDIAYNFAVMPSGRAYELRGLNKQNGANGTNSGNRTSHAIYIPVGPSQKLTEAAVRTIYELNYWIGDQAGAPRGIYKGHRDWKATSCPGEFLYALCNRTFEKPGSLPLQDVPRSDKEEILGRGDKGELVKQLQDILNINFNADLIVDGDFGPATETAVRAAQGVIGVKQDGLWGPDTDIAFIEWKNRVAEPLIPDYTLDEYLVAGVFSLELGRNPDTAGMTYWSETVAKIADKEKAKSVLVENIRASQEWKDKHK